MEDGSAASISGGRLKEEREERDPDGNCFLQKRRRGRRERLDQDSPMIENKFRM